MMGVGFDQCEADACVIFLVESRVLSFVVVDQVDDIFAMRFNSWCEKLCEDLGLGGSCQQTGGFALVGTLPIFSRLGCRDVDDMTAGFR